MIKNTKQASILKQRINHLRNAKREVERLVNRIVPGEDIAQSISLILDEASRKLEAEVEEFAQSNKITEKFSLETAKLIGKELIMVRLSLGWSQSTLGARANVSRQSIYKYEKEEYQQTSLKKIQEIAEVLTIGIKEMEEERRELQRQFGLRPTDLLPLHQPAAFDKNWQSSQDAECGGDVNHDHGDLRQSTVCKT